MTPALNPFLLPKAPTADRSLVHGREERLPVPQALMVITVLAALCWLVIGALAAWLIG